MDNERIRELIEETFLTTPGNFISKEAALRPDLEGLQLFDAPFFGVAAADDPIFTAFKEPAAIGAWHQTPTERMPAAKSVLSVCFPFTERVRASNRTETHTGSMEWMHARMEGQSFQTAFTKALRERLAAEGVTCCVPSLDGTFTSFNYGKGLEGYPGITENTFTSNWSERHAAYAAGLGTFGLSKGLITKRGIAVRFSSLILDCALTPTPRPYTGVYDYCTKCGACAKRCPANAISVDGGKAHVPCHEHVRGTSRDWRIGCGLCQTGVPCESGIPADYPGTR